MLLWVIITMLSLSLSVVLLACCSSFPGCFSFPCDDLLFRFFTIIWVLATVWYHVRLRKWMGAPAKGAATWEKWNWFLFERGIMKRSSCIAKWHTVSCFGTQRIKGALWLACYSFFMLPWLSAQRLGPPSRMQKKSWWRQKQRASSVSKRPAPT